MKYTWTPAFARACLLAHAANHTNRFAEIDLCMA